MSGDADRYPHERIAFWEAAEAELRASDRRFSQARMAVVLVGLGLAWMGADTGWFPWWTALLAVPVFAVLVTRHDRVALAHRRAARCIRFHRRALARRDGEWVNEGNTGAEFADEDHPYALDLDIVGPGSLFQFLDTAVTRMGERRLAAWLLAPAEFEEARARHSAVAELAGKPEFREDLASFGDGAAVHPDALRDWSAKAGEIARLGAVRVVAAVLVVFTLAASVVSLASESAAPVLAAAAIQLLFAASYRRRVRAVMHDSDRALRELRVLAEVLGRIRDERFTDAKLATLRNTVASGESGAAPAIAELAGLVDRLDARRNELFAPLAAAMLWTTQFALAIEAWRGRHGKDVEAWLDAVGEIEALAALATFHHEQPESKFPEFVTDRVVYRGVALAHPLLPADRRVANDVELGSDLRLWIVSGSNMSGKSTLLRAVGCNLVLAHAGAPVVAKSLCVSPLQLGAAMRSVDSLQSGRSRFLAEIQRIRTVSNLAEQGDPLLFLLDEVLSGTNSHDRRAGAEGIVRSLLRRGAIGLLTTHDLALADLAEREELRARNVHFEDTWVDGQMSFDYRLRPGVVRKSNAMELMRAIGLEV